MFGNKPSFLEKLNCFKKQLTKYDGSLPFPKQKALINRHLLSPVVIKNCNGDGPCIFSSATMTFNYWFSIPLYLLYNKAIKQLCAGLKMKGHMNTDQREAFECLLDFFYFGKHLTCLKSLLTDHDKHEHEVQTILALHLFSPLVHPSSCAVDKFNFLKEVSCCPTCGEAINLENTSFGNRDVWFGNADIMIGRSIIKVDMVDEHTNSEDSSDDILEEPLCKRVKFSHNVDGIRQQTTAQALAQTIVNSFCEVKKDRKLVNCLIPSLRSTEKHVQINFYAVNSDILLNSEELPIWNSSDSFDMSTIIYIWLTLNFDRFDCNMLEFILETFPKSGFNDRVKDVYHVYSEQMSKPLPEDNQHIERKKERLYFEDIMNYPDVVTALNEVVAEAEDTAVYAI